VKNYLLWTSSQVKEIHITYVEYHKNKHTGITWNPKEPISRSLEFSRNGKCENPEFLENKYNQIVTRRVYLGSPSET